MVNLGSWQLETSLQNKNSHWKLLVEIWTWNVNMGGLRDFVFITCSHMPLHPSRVWHWGKLKRNTEAILGKKLIWRTKADKLLCYKLSLCSHLLSVIKDFLNSRTSYFCISGRKKDIKRLHVWCRKIYKVEKSIVNRKGCENFEVKICFIDWGYKSTL